MKIPKWCHDVKVGDYVTSNYRRRWSGIVLEVEKRKDQEPLIKVRKVLDQHGNLIRRGMQLHQNIISAGWMQPATQATRAKIVAALLQTTRAFVKPKRRTRYSKRRAGDDS